LENGAGAGRVWREACGLGALPEPTSEVEEVVSPMRAVKDLEKFSRECSVTL